MNLLIRLLLVLVSRFFRKPLKVLEESCLHFWVLPNDLDIYGHMNNGRFLTIMDLGRIDLILRSKLGKVASEHKWNPLVAQSHMLFKRPLQLFEGYVLRTRILGWDHKWFFIEQDFEYRGKVIARGYVKGLFRGKQGNITPEKVLRLADENHDSPELSQKILSLFSHEDKA